jgi:hypothetical protein
MSEEQQARRNQAEANYTESRTAERTLVQQLLDTELGREQAMELLRLAKLALVHTSVDLKQLKAHLEGIRPTRPPPGALLPPSLFAAEYLSLRVSVPSSAEGDRVSPTHRPREDWLAHPAGTSKTNLATALGVLSR